MKQYWPLLFLFLGEIVYIVAEMYLTKIVNENPERSMVINMFIKTFLITTVSGLFILLGYYFGYKSVKNIWLISATAISAILITEPITGILLFKDKASNGSIIGLLLGGLGMVATIWIK